MAETEIMDHENPVVRFRCEDISSDSDVKISLTNGGTPENGPGNSSEEGRLVFIKQWARPVFIKKYIVLLLVSVSLLISVVFNIIQAVRPVPLQATPGPSDGCLPSWIKNEDWCYFFSEKQETFTLSQKNCSSYDASLVILDSMPEQAFIKDKGLHIEYWLDLQRKNKEQEWKWSDGSPVAPFSVRGDNLCGYLNGDDISSTTCDNIRHWICKKLVHR